MGKDYTDIKFKNGSTLSIAAALDSDRGLRKHSCLVDETRDQDGEALAEIILPQLNVSRRMENGEVNPYEMINQQVIYTTSAGLKSSFAYEKLIEVFEDSIIDSKRSFSVGLDYRIPAMHGLVSQDYVNKLKTSATYNENTFAAEYMSSWQGGSVESWFNYDKVSKYRTLKNAERERHVLDGQNSWYLLSVDVGRISDQTVVCVFKVSEKNNTFYSSLVYIEVLGRTPETKLFTKQAIDLKRLIKKFSPREVVVDINGLGVGIGDELIKTQVDEYGELYPAYGFINDETYRKVQPKDAPQILFGIKANAQLNSQIHGNAYSRTNSGKVRFLVREQEAKAALLATKRGQKMTLAERTQFLMPYEMTTSLFNEILNLRLKHTGNINDIALERINSRFPKDKYSAFSYGLWRIKELEEAHYKFLNKCKKKKQLIYFSGGS